MRETANPENHEGFRKRLIAAVTEICRNETFYEDEMRIEGTICLVSDRNSFVVFQITELIGSQSDELPLFENSSNADDNNSLTFANANSIADKNNNENNNKWLENIDRRSASNTLEQEMNGGCMVGLPASLEADVINQSTNLSLSETSINNSFRSSDYLSQSNSVDNNHHRISKSTLYSLNTKKRNCIYRPMRHRRRMAYSSSHSNTNLANNLLQTIKQETPDFDVDNATNDSLSLLNLTGNLENDVNNLNPDASNALTKPTKLFKSKKGINSSVFSGRCYEEIYVRTPHGLYRYMCRLCNSMFKIRNGLYEHLNGHFGRRPHACRQCDAKFAHHSSLHNHVRNKHSVQTEEEKQASMRHVCVMCGRRFRYPSELERHKSIHEEFPVNPQQRHSSENLSDMFTNQHLTQAHQDFLLVDASIDPSHININNNNNNGNSGNNIANTSANNNNNSNKNTTTNNNNNNGDSGIVDHHHQGFEYQIFDHLANMSAIVDPIVTGDAGKIAVPTP